jgi:hypothetical protein
MLRVPIVIHSRAHFIAVMAQMAPLRERRRARHHQRQEQQKAHA